ncbi:hypothetical protein C8Q70DRAFT_563697 [Cubamyces menziesii]|nr:hypothetical protein C8Q70DRAFT_563697 [Cubamyces menziesii]
MSVGARRVPAGCTPPPQPGFDAIGVRSCTRIYPSSQTKTKDPSTYLPDPKKIRCVRPASESKAVHPSSGQLTSTLPHTVHPSMVPSSSTLRKMRAFSLARRSLSSDRDICTEARKRGHEAPLRSHHGRSLLPTNHPQPKIVNLTAPHGPRPGPFFTRA